MNDTTKETETQEYKYYPDDHFLYWSSRDYEDNCDQQQQEQQQWG